MDLLLLFLTVGRAAAAAGATEAVDDEEDEFCSHSEPDGSIRDSPLRVTVLSAAVVEFSTGVDENVGRVRTADVASARLNLSRFTVAPV